MSATWGLVKFKKTGNIYMACYEGTSDYLRPFICTPEECYNEKLDCYCSIIYCRELSKDRDYQVPDDVEDLDEVEIYANYGGGSYWAGTGSESLKMIKDGRNPFEERIEEIDGEPEWVEQFEKELSDDIKLEDTFTMEDDFLYFCIWDDCMGIVSSRNIELPAIVDSCYVSLEEVFLVDDE